MNKSTRCAKLIIPTVFAVFFAAPAQAVICNSNATGNWNNAGTWSCGHVPLNADDVTIIGNTTVTVNIAGAVANSVTVGDASNSRLSSLTFNAATSSLTVANDVIITAPTSNTAGRDRQILVNAGTLTVNGNVTLEGSARTNTYTRLTLTTGTATIAGGLTVNSSTTAGRAVVTAGTGTINVDGAAGVTNGDRVIIGAGNFNVTNAAATFSNSSASIVAATTVSTGTLNVAGNLANAAADTITVSSTGNITVGGDWSNNGTFTRGTGRVTFNGAAAQNLGGTAATIFNNLTINNTGGDVTITSASVALSPTVNGILTLTSGHVITTVGTNDLGLGTAGTVSGGSTASYVVGAVQKNYAAVGTLTFPVGDSTNYTPVVIQGTAGFAAGSSLTISTTGGGDHPSIASSGIDSTKSVNRYWTLTPTGMSAGSTYNATFNYINGSPVDFDTGATPANFIVEQWDGSSWFPATLNATCTATPATNLCERINGETGFGDFAIGEPVAGFNANPGVFNTFETTTSTTQILGRIFTKLVGTSFPLSIVAVSNNARNTLPLITPLTVDVIDASPTGGTFTASSNCYSNWTTVIQTQTVLVPVWTSGRIDVTINAPSKAVSNARIRVTQGTSIGCSTDNFAIRPVSFTSVVSGAPVNMNNVGTSGAPSAIAGSSTFTLIAATGVAGYTGTPKIDNTAVQAHAGAIQNGAVSGTFPAAATATGTSTGTSAFTYSEVGNFRFLGYDPASDTTTARGVYDDTFTAVDGSSDCSADFANALSGGQYGCKFGITANSSYFGRFYPKDFLLTSGTLINRQAASCAPASSFTYAGEQLRVTFTLMARNGAATPAITKNYDPTAGFALFNANTIANLGFGAVDLADAIPPTTATALTASLTPGTSSGTWASGSVPVTADLMLTRAASPDGPFESFNLGVDPVDADGVKLNSYDLDTTVPADTSDHGLVGTSKIRFGRMKISNAYGSELLDLSIPIAVQYWNDTQGWVQNNLDGCTSIIQNNIKLSNSSVTIGSVTSAGGGEVECCSE